MAKEIYSLSLDSIKLLCGLIRDLASVSEGILDTAICTDKTFSSYYIDLLLKQLKADSEAYTDEVASALTKLTAEVVTVEPTLDNTTNKINTILLYSPGGNDVYDQYLRLETQLISLGSTQISMADYIKTSEADNKYSTKTELKAVTDKIGTTTLTTTAQTLTGSIEEVKGIAEQGAMLTVTKEQYQQLVAGQTVSIDGKDYTYDSNTYYVVKDDGDTIVTTSTISSSSTDSEVPTAKAIFDALKNDKTIGIDYTYENSDSLNINLTKAGLYKIYSPTEGVPEGNPKDYTLLNIPWRDDSTKMRFGYQMLFTPRCAYYWVRTVWNYDPSTYTYTEGDYSIFRKWQKVCAAVPDVNRTTITFTNGTNYTAIGSSSLNYYTVKNGMCYVSLDVSVTSKASEWTTVYTLPKPIATKIDISHSFVDEVGDSYIAYGVWEDGTLKIKKGENGIRYIINFSYPVAES